MPIEIQHGRAGTLLDAATASRQRGDQRVLDQRSFQRENREDEQAFRQQENLRNRQQQVDIQESAEQARMDQEKLRADIQKQSMVDEYKMKDDYEKNQIDKQRSQYVHQRELIDNEYAGGNGKISYPQYIKAQEDLNSQYGTMITSPVFGDVKKLAEEHPSMDIDGNDYKMAINPKTGKPDPFLTEEGVRKRKHTAEKEQAAHDLKVEAQALKEREQAFNEKMAVKKEIEDELKMESKKFKEIHPEMDDASLNKFLVDKRKELNDRYSDVLPLTEETDPGTIVIDENQQDIQMGPNQIVDPMTGQPVGQAATLPSGPTEPPSKSNPELKDDPEVNYLIGIIKSGGQLTAEQWKRLNDYRSKL